MGAEGEKGVKQDSEVSRLENTLKEYLALLWEMGKKEKGIGQKGREVVCEAQAGESHQYSTSRELSDPLSPS